MRQRFSQGDGPQQGECPKGTVMERATRRLLALRCGGLADSEVLLDINRRSTTASYQHIFPPERYPFPDSAVRSARLALLQSPDHHFLIAERGGVAVGFACYSPGGLDELFVVPEEWGRGAADRLHSKAVRAAAAGGQPVRLWVLAENHRARRFYEKHGWRVDGREAKADHPPYPLKLGYTLEGRRST